MMQELEELRISDRLRRPENEEEMLKNVGKGAK
jgi:hypothetical protein